MLLYGVDVRFYMQIENELRCICNCVKMTTICLLEQVIPLLARTWSSGQAQAYPSEAWELSRQMYWHPLLLLPQGLVPANPNTISIWQSRIESVVTCSKNTQWHRYCSARGRACNRQDFEIGRISFTRVLKYVSITGVLSCTLVTGWLEIEALKLTMWRLPVQNSSGPFLAQRTSSYVASPAWQSKRFRSAENT